MKLRAILFVSLLVMSATLFSMQIRTTDASDPANGLFYVLVDSGIYEGVESSIDQYATDLRNEGYSVCIYNISGENPDDIRLLLSTAVPNGLVGALFVGDIPEVQYGTTSEAYPIDLFYTDVDGVWTDLNGDGIYDSHQGDTGAEIFLGRLKASHLDGDEVSMINNYFQKAHNYRIGALSLWRRALVYFDIDTMLANAANSWVKSAYDQTTLVTDPWITNSTDYVERLTEGMGYEWVHLTCHGNPTGHTFTFPNGWDGSVSSWSYRNYDLKAMFYQFYSCSIANYTAWNNLASTIALATTYSLLVIGCTRPLGGSLNYASFYNSIAQATSIGMAFQTAGFSSTEIGMTIIGDPTLKITRVHNGNNGFGYHSIGEAINAASSGDTLYVGAGTFCEKVLVGKPLTITGRGPTVTAIDGEGSGTIFTIDADNVNISGFTVRNGTIGIKAELSNYVDIDDSVFSNVNYGVILKSSYYTHVGNSLFSNGQYGIYLNRSSNNDVTTNTLMDNDYGIYVDWSNENTFAENRLMNNHYAVYLDCSYNNVIAGNSVKENGYTSADAAIHLSNSLHNRIEGNLVSNNFGDGIYLYMSPNTTIVHNDILWNLRGLHMYDSETPQYRCTTYHNSFVNNSEAQVSIYSSSAYTNAWDAGYPSGGNHWSDYSGVDQNGDGIGDTAYRIDRHNKDNYPFMDPIAFNITIDYVAACKTIVGKGYTMHFNVTVHNREPFIKAFDVIAYVNSTVAASATYILKGGESTNITFIWNTAGLSYGYYTVNAATGTYAYQYYSLQNGGVLVTIPGDVNGDKSVNVVDSGEVSAHWYPGPPAGPLGYDPNVDIDDDGRISLTDSCIVGAHWGESW